jgi:hypothetical protein
VSSILTGLTAACTFIWISTGSYASSFAYLFDEVSHSGLVPLDHLLHSFCTKALKSNRHAEVVNLPLFLVRFLCETDADADRGDCAADVRNFDDSALSTADVVFSYW